ncbi:MAG: VTT domain-containing protein [Methanomicrobiales archaeon]|nr:VTT domain-containing protein [Methanomicrobiales archaeon]
MTPPDFLITLPNILLNIQDMMPQLMETYGIWIYAILFAIIFCETGLVFTPFLPGDSLLFLAGFLAAGGGLSVLGIIVILSVAAILGDSVNYRIGTSFGNWLIHRERCLVDRKHIAMTRQYYKKYGKKTIIVARFIPGIRAFAPFVAGIVKMRYPVFLSYNVIGGILWVTSFVLFGYVIASLPVFREQQHLFLWAILVISIGIFLVMMWNFRKEMKECELTPDEMLRDMAAEMESE